MLKIDFENLRKTEETFKELNEYNLFKEAGLVFNALTDVLAGNLKEADPELVKKFKLLKAKFGFIAISTLAERDISYLYDYYLGVALDISNYNLWDNLEKHHIAFSDYDYRNEVKKKIRDIIVKSKSIITNSGLMLNNARVYGTAENWFRDYNSYLGSLDPVDKLKFEEYFINSANIKKLEKAEKGKIKNLFQFYEKLKLSSKTPEGFEERIPIVIDGVLRIWKDGGLEEIDPEAKKAVEELGKLGFFKEDAKEEKLKELQTLINQYPPNSLERKAIIEEIERLNRR